MISDDELDSDDDDDDTGDEIETGRTGGGNVGGRKSAARPSGPVVNR